MGRQLDHVDSLPESLDYRRDLFMSGFIALVEKAFGVAIGTNPGLLMAAATLLVAVLVGGIAAAGSEAIKKWFATYLVAAFVFGILPVLAIALQYRRTFGVLIATGILTAAAAWKWPVLRRRTWIPALLALIPFIGIGAWEQREIRERRASEPTVAVLRFTNKNPNAQDLVVRNTWVIFRDTLTAVLRPVGRIKVQPVELPTDGGMWNQITVDNAVTNLEAIGVYPDAVIAADIKPTQNSFRLLPSLYVVENGGTRRDWLGTPETSDEDEFDTLALVQVLAILPRLTGDVRLTADELKKACLAVIEEHAKTLDRGSPAVAELWTHAAQCPDGDKIAAVLRNALRPRTAAEDPQQARNREAAAAVLGAAIGSDQ